MNDSKTAICEALRELMARQPLASISIQGVCDKARLSRKTFSRNFASLQEVVVCQMELDFVQPMRDFNRIMDGLVVDTDTVLLRNIRTLKKYAGYYNKIVHAYGAPWFSDQLARLSIKMDFDPYEVYGLDAAEHSFVETFFAYAVAQSLLWWLEQGMQTPEEEVARMCNGWIYAHCRELGGQLASV